jgi:superfamily II DNA or RNA helicase
MSILHVSSCVTIFKDENPHLEIHELRKKYTYENPLYYKNLNLGFSTFGIPKTISLLAEHADRIELPRGLISDLIQRYPDITIIDNTTIQPTHSAASTIIFKPYQEEALNKMVEKNQGILTAPPGTGKTIIGIELILKQRQKSLVLVHTKALLQQWSDRIEQFTGMIPGRINADQYDIKSVTIATVQTLNRSLERAFFNQFGFVLLDEAHHCPAQTFRDLICRIPARYRYGLTATPERQDGLTFLLHAVLGSTVYALKKDGLFLSGDILRPHVKAIHTGFHMPNIADYATLIETVTHNNDRNSLIIQQVKDESEKGHYCLALSERISHAIRLHTMFRERSSLKAACITGTHSEKQRSENIAAVNDGSVHALFATKIADEGLDVRRLDRLFLTCPFRATNKLNQQIGRIMRVFPGKKDCIVFDFVDSLNSLAASQYFTRREEVYGQYQLEEIPCEAHREY